MEDNIYKNKKIENKMNSYLYDTITSLSYSEEKTKEKLELRKKKIFNLIFNNRKEIFINNKMIEINNYKIIDINQLICDDEIRKDVKNYINSKFKINEWIKYLFSSNNNIQLTLFLIKEYIDSKLISENIKSNLSNNDNELIQRLCDCLLFNDIKINYYACACLTNLTFFPYDLERHIYTINNLEKILKFFNILSNNIMILGYECLFLFINIFFNNDVIIYLINNKFLDNLYNFINNIINNINNNFNHIFEFNVIKYCIKLLSILIKVCKIKSNYINNFILYIPLFKLITSKYYINSLIIDESSLSDLLAIWKFYSKKRNNNEEIINEIFKDDFIKLLILLFYKLNNTKIIKEIFKIFCDFSQIDEDEKIEILFNNQIIQFFYNEIENYQNLTIENLNLIILSCSNLALGNIGQIEKIYESGIIFKIIDIIIIIINKTLDNEIQKLLTNSIIFLSNIIEGSIIEIKKNILNYKKCIIIEIYSKILKLHLNSRSKEDTIPCIIISINELNNIYDELEENLQKQYAFMLINNSLDDSLAHYYDKKIIQNNLSEKIENIEEFIKNKKLTSFDSF